MSEAPFWPVATGDFISDTMHLSAEETGAYMMLLMCLWRNNGAPLKYDQKQFARMARVTPHRWPRIWSTIKVFFSMDDNYVTQNRVLKDWVTVQKKITRNREKGKLGGRPKSLKSNGAAKATGLAQVSPGLSPTEPNQNQNKESKKKGGVSKAKFVDTCLEKAGIDGSKKISPGWHTEQYRRVDIWLNAGIEKSTIVNTIAAVAERKSGDPPGSLKYFERPIQEAHEAVAAGESLDEGIRWKARLSDLRRTGLWLTSWGPEPGREGCVVPQRILEEFAEGEPVEAEATA